jgi:hypothetical protein
MLGDQGVTIEATPQMLASLLSEKQLLVLDDLERSGFCADQASSEDGQSTNPKATELFGRQIIILSATRRYQRKGCGAAPMGTLLVVEVNLGTWREHAQLHTSYPRGAGPHTHTRCASSGRGCARQQGRSAATSPPSTAS